MKWLAGLFVIGLMPAVVLVSRESAVGVAAAGVVIDNLFQRPKAAVVHVGRGAGHFAKRRCLEVASACAYVGKRSRLA